MHVRAVLRGRLHRRFCTVLVAVLLIGVLLVPPSAHAQRPVPKTASLTITDVMIPVGDTIDLHGRLYRPAADSARPTILSMTPYTADDPQTATVKLHVSPDRPSTLVLPVRSE